MVNERSYILGSQRSCIRELFEYGRRRAAEVGAENIYDFSLGNPSVPTPDEIKAAYLELLDTKSSLDLHGYTSAAGCNEQRDQQQIYPCVIFHSGKIFQYIAKALYRRTAVTAAIGNAYLGCVQLVKLLRRYHLLSAENIAVECVGEYTVV